MTTAGYDAVKDIFPETTVIVHLDNGFNNELYNYIFDGLKANGGKWDMIGMSLYPYWSIMYKHVKNADEAITRCMDNIRRMSRKYNCPVMIVETGMESAKPEEGKAQLARIIRQARMETEGKCRGVFYWEPNVTPLLTYWVHLLPMDTLPPLWKPLRKISECKSLKSLFLLHSIFS